MKILIIRFSSIGDIVLTGAAVRCIRLQVPDAEVHYATKAQYAQVVESIPHIDKVHFLEDSLGDLIRRLQNEHFDFVVDLHKNIRSLLVRLALKVPSSAYHKATFGRYLYVFFTRLAKPVPHIAERYIQAASRLGVCDDGQGLDYRVLQKDLPTQIPFTDFSYRVWILGAKFKTKALPPEKIIQALQGYAGNMVLIGGQDVLAEAAVIQHAFPQVVNACGKLSWHESVRVLQGAQMVYANDTGLMHVAAALKKRIHVFYGSSVPEFGFEPYQTEWTEHGVKDLWCRPCSKIGFAHCPLGHFKCMQQQQFQLDQE